MALCIGEPSRNASEQSFRKTRIFALTTFSCVAVLGILPGYCIGSMFPYRNLPALAGMAVISILSVITILVSKWAMKRMEVLDRERMAWRKGAIGESQIALTLSQLPDPYVVVHDITDYLSNIDHVVIGPTGIYVVDTKNWKGSMSANPDGELLVNGKATVKPTVQRMLSTVMDFQSKLKTLTRREFFVRGIIAFPNAHVGVKLGATKQIHCLGEDHLLAYFENGISSNRLNSGEIELVKRAVLQLAHMDERFSPVTAA